MTATVRDPNKADALKAVGPVQIEKLDMDDQQAVIALSQRLKERTFDLLFVNAGVKGPANQEPGHATLAEVGQLFFTNAVAPINLAQRFVGQIRKDSGVLAFMSSVLGSVTIPDGSDLALYKASKAALNSMTNTFFRQLPEPKPTVLSMHPGWVKTDFHRRAGIKTSSIPDFIWVDSDRVAAEALADADKGRVISVPTKRWKLQKLVARHAPRSTVRWASRMLSRSRQ